MSVIITTSDASIADSEPTPPIEIPISEIARTGESLIPSPTKATLQSLLLFSFTIFSISLYLFSGNISAFMSVIPTIFPTSFATSSLSPVNILVFICIAFNFSIISFVPGFILSDKTT